ncbi:hypothetical protein GCM10022243_28750 [Saccharothrix violaceirubra]|uniref:Uncharacterized protein n=1 Tax=Saccharothrix violaceirubra TaxID=413306 RepID=A0A7W7WZ78_9PSEU|nr:hypothetical protein [Saccharothrix violaceirubra]MBB4969200.1 hypothetical protein [Saccharothrix violaceirubra]
MDASLFSLVSEDAPSLVFAWGMEIIDEDGTKAIIYRPATRTERSLIGKHDSAEAALRRWRRHFPLKLVWDYEDVDLPDEADESEESSETAL